jgi:hypothetical protein
VSTDSFAPEAQSEQGASESQGPGRKLRKSMSMLHFGDLEFAPAAQAEEAWETWLLSIGPGHRLR